MSVSSTALLTSFCQTRSIQDDDHALKSYNEEGQSDCSPGHWVDNQQQIAKLESNAPEAGQQHLSSSSPTAAADPSFSLLSEGTYLKKEGRELTGTLSFAISDDQVRKYSTIEGLKRYEVDWT